MKITKRGEYALRTMLALASKARSHPLSLRQLSQEEKLPVKFLEQIMMTLKKAGLVQSTKGKHGGYVLSRPPSKIKLGEIIRVIDGPLSPLETGEEIRKKILKEERHPGLYAVFFDVRNATCAIIDKTSLADVCEKSSDLVRTKGVMYYI